MLAPSFLMDLVFFSQVDIKMTEVKLNCPSKDKLKSYVRNYFKILYEGQSWITKWFAISDSLFNF